MFANYKAIIHFYETNDVKSLNDVQMKGSFFEKILRKILIKDNRIHLLFMAILAIVPTSSSIVG